MIVVMVVVMIVIAARAMLVMVAMIVVGARMIVVMVMRVMVVTMHMRRRVGMSVAAGVVSAAFRIERRLDLHHPCAKTTQHVFDHMIAADAQRLCHHLGRQVAVAEMPRQPHHMQRIDAAHFQQRLRRGNHFDQPPIIECERIAATQRNRLRQIKNKREPARSGHRHPAAMPVIEIKHHRVGGGFCPLGLTNDFGRAKHICRHILSTLPSLMISISVGDTLNGADSARHVFM